MRESVSWIGRAKVWRGRIKECEEVKTWSRRKKARSRMAHIQEEERASKAEDGRAATAGKSKVAGWRWKNEEAMAAYEAQPDGR